MEYGRCPGDNTRPIESDAVHFYLPAYIGPRGWVAYRLDQRNVNWSEVKELVTGSYTLTTRAARSKPK